MGETKKSRDTGGWPGAVTEFDMYLFGEGAHYDIYKKLGAHLEARGSEVGVRFAVWAPNGKKVSVVGDFNAWDHRAHIMERLGSGGIHELFVPGVKEGDLYKFCIETQDGRLLYKADPFANYAQLRPNTASIVADINSYHWGDGSWMAKREASDIYRQPISIYEVHMGSWKQHPGREREEEAFYSYREFAQAIAEYVQEMGYTHVELIGILEYPFDGSWGYQVTGYYAPTSRYGTPEDFMYLVDYLHQHGIGVILDWVPAHFPKDAHGLAEFDGTCLYEYADPRKGEHADWGTKVFDYEKNEVKNFLIGSALLWVEHYHIDGLRVDAVASMLYLDYGRRDGDWAPNRYGGNRNLEAIEFFKHLNTLIQGRNKNVMMIAEESTAWPGVTGDVMEDGLHFTFKWNMGWMHDFLDYMRLDPYFRRDNHNKMTFAMSYNYSENYILVLSHDEVVHLKCSMVNKMPGEGLAAKMANLKAGYAFMMGHPGKKLLFMGQEFGQLREWSEARELDWNLLENVQHQQLQKFVRALLHLYRRYPAMHARDFEVRGFEWINADDNYRSIFSFIRRSPTGRENLLFVLNFTPVEREDYRVGVPWKRKYRLILNSDDTQYGGTGEARPESYAAERSECDGRKYSFAYKLPAFGVAVFLF